MRRCLECDFFVGEDEPERVDEARRVRVLAGPRGIVIADALISVDGGRRVCHGEAFATASGLELVYHSEHDAGAPQQRYAVEIRFVVKGARYHPSLHCTVRGVHRAVPGDPPADAG